MATIRTVLLLLLPCYSQALFQACSLCVCDRNSGSVRCHKLEKFPEVSAFPVNTTSIEITHSNLTNGIPSDQLQQLSNLKQLVLNYNTIKNITRFGPLNLVVVRLDHNDIEEVVSGAFDNLPILSHLSLEYNRLTSFPSFKKTSKVTELFLQGNIRLKTLSRESLQNLPLLQNLDLEDTGIAEIPDAIFESNKHLLKINLADTISLISIHDNAFGEISPLQTLILDNTRITSLPKQGLENLQYLSLKNVPNFWQLPSTGLWRMREVHLSQYNSFLCCAVKLNKYNKDCATRIHHRGGTTAPPSTTSQPQPSQSTIRPTPGTTTAKSGGGFTWPGGGGGLTWPSQTTSRPMPGTTTAKSGGGFTWPGGGGGLTWPSQTTSRPMPGSTTAKSGGGFTWPGGGGGLTWPSQTTSRPMPGTTTAKSGGGFTWPGGGGGLTWPSQTTSRPMPGTTTAKSGGGFTWPGGGGGLTWPSQTTSRPAPGTTTAKSGGGGWTWPIGPQTTPSSNASSGGSLLPNATQQPTSSSNGTTGGGGFPGNARELAYNSTQQPSVTTSGGGGSWPGGGGGFVTPPAGVSTHKVNTYTMFTIPGVHNTTVVPPSKMPAGNQSNASVYQCPNDPIEVKCFPEPDAFHPCEDIMGYTLLTAVSLLVGLLAVFANLVVAVVLLTSQKRFNVTRFLMCNLAFADFSLGLYILILTCFSIETHGEYYNYVRTWQQGVGCKILGFLAVFSSELSLFTLVVMTMERFYAIVYAMHLNARLSFRWAVRAMSCGWLFAIIMAVLPLVGASSYEMVAVCLPFDVTSAGSTAYVSLMLILNGLSFILVVYLYARMLLVVVRGGGMEGAPKRNDSKVAKRMAVLVFTDMACWAPIAFFGLLAAFGVPLISVTESKILIVFFFPINSICNPFLYAFLTKAFKREFFPLLSRFGFCKFRALKYNGTLSSFLYSRSRRNQSNDDRLKRISTVSSPSFGQFSNDDRSKRISTVSTPSVNDFKRSNVDLVSTDAKPREKIEFIQMNGISNVAYIPEETQISIGTTAKFVKSPSGAEDDEVFIRPKLASISNSPKSILKKTSTVDNSHVVNAESEHKAKRNDCNGGVAPTAENIENAHINGVSNLACDQEDFKTSTPTSTAESPGTPSSPKSVLKKVSVIENKQSDNAVNE